MREATWGRRRLTLAPRLPAAGPVTSPPAVGGSRFSCLGSDYGSSDEEAAPAVGVRMALDVLGEGEDNLEWTPVCRRGRKTDAEIVQEFWNDVGFPTPASRFWERQSSSSPGTPPVLEGEHVVSCRAQEKDMDAAGPERARTASSASSAAVEIGRNPSSSPSGLRLARAPRMGSWRGPLPPRRITPPPVLGQFMDKAKVIHSQVGSPAPASLPGSEADRDATSEATSTELQIRNASDVGPRLHAGWATGHTSWAYLKQRMRALWYPTQPPSVVRTDAAQPPAIASSPSTAFIEPRLPLQTPPPQTAPLLHAGAGRSYATVAAALQRPMAGVPPPTRATSATGGPNPRGPSRPAAPAPTPTFNGPAVPHQQQRGPAPNYGNADNQPPVYGLAGQFQLPYGLAANGGPAPMYGPSPSGVTAAPQFVPFAVGQLGVVQKRKKKKKPMQQQLVDGTMQHGFQHPPQHMPVQQQFPHQPIPQQHMQPYQHGQYQQYVMQP